MLTPSIGFCATPLNCEGSSTPTSSRTVGATSMTWWNWSRNSPRALMRFGQEIARPFRVPPKWLATCLVHWKGVSIAQAQAAGKWL